MKIYLVHRLGRGYHDESWTDFSDMNVSAFSNEKDAIDFAAQKNAELICNNDYIFEDINPKDFFNLTIDSSKKEIFNLILKVGLDKFVSKLLEFDECESYTVSEINVK